MALRALLLALTAVSLAAAQAQWLNEPADGSSSGDAGVGGGDAAGTANAQQLCDANSGWRSTALAQHPTASADFVPESATYWKGPVVHAAWPALIGLAAAAGLLLVFLLWRCLRCCCACCCCCCRRQRAGHFKYHTARWLSCLKVLSLMLAAGVAGGAAFGIARVDAGLLGAGEDTLDGVQAFLTSVIREGRGALAAADAMLASLGDVRAVLEEQVNVTDISAQLQCLAPFLDGLPEPAALAADTVAANASMDSTLRPALVDLSTQLGSLAERLEPGVGSYVQALETATGAQVLLFDSPGGIVTQANEFASVAQQLGPSEDPVQLKAAADTLSAMLPLTDSLQALVDLRAALAVLQAAATTDPFVPSAVADLQAVQGVADAVTGIAGTLQTLRASGLLLLLPSLHTTIQQQRARMDAATSQLEAQPLDVQPYMDSLEAVQGTYDQLPLQPSQLAVEAQAEVEALVQGVQQSLDAAQQTVQDKAADVRGYLADADEQTVGRLARLRTDYMPSVRKYDKIRVAVLYTIFSLACALALLLLLAEIFNYPLGLKVTMALALLYMALCFALVAALTVGLKVGNDGCVNLEDQIVLRIPDALSNPADAAKALAVARYYLFGVGDVDSLLQDAFGFDLHQVQQQINDTRVQLLQDITERFSLQPLLAAPVDQALGSSFNVQRTIDALLAAAGRDQVYPVYLTAKQFVCCRTLDMVGNQWLGLILAASCGVALCGVAMCCLSSLDSLGVKLKGWCACYRRKHFMDEAPFPTTSPPPGSKAAAAAAAGKGGKSKVQLAADSRSGAPGSPAAQFIASWHGKQGSLREQYGGGGGEIGSSVSEAEAGAERGAPASSTRPSRLAAGSPQLAAAAAADRAELLGSRSGSPASRPSSPQGAGNGGGSNSAAARDVEAANRAELLSSPAAASSRGSSSSPAARGRKESSGKGGGSRIKGLFK
ncbi:urea ABC transporter permease subunit [Chlorella sorokiniana]|uniref:Urea ABC transporter permease subunit n=1 Tax=Chlorella sorokiniana TaxID=3076 RepID=A0A2P6TIH4_CHLSO|nr:urea ABC transporter permease subunit [Chlorella sorokiniana]|eukprot:PRW34091.1 urea ABC transporter permease subunit [Chlorella sorokiniana]